MKVSRLLLVVVLAAACGRTSAAQRPANPAPTPADAARAAGEQKTSTNPAVNADAALIADFKARVDAYMAVRKQALKDAPKLKETHDPAKIKAAQDEQSTKIRALRMTAKQGDVFTPAITAKFRQLLAPETKGEDGRDAKNVLKDDAPAPGTIPFKVNARYPEGAPVPTVPASFLINLPPLPEPLQYKVIDKHLLLLDEDADVIVDYMLNAIR
jgi:hypothetical protein